MIANKQKQQAFRSKLLKSLTSNLDDHIGFNGAGQFNKQLAEMRNDS
jgi:hypothetical protein